MWLLPRTDTNSQIPCYRDNSGSDTVTHIWLDENKWKLVQRQYCTGPDELLASLPASGRLPAPNDMWHLESVLGRHGVISVHIWTLLEFKAKSHDGAYESKFKQLSQQVAQLKSLVDDVETVKAKVSTWEEDRETLHSTVTNVKDMVATLKRRQDSYDDELKVLRDQTRQRSPLRRKKVKRCGCDLRSRAVSRQDTLQAGTVVMFLQNGILEDRVISRITSRGRYLLEAGKHGSSTLANEKQLFIRDQCRHCQPKLAKS